ncbi:hypothetical protein [Sphingomonas oryzagri]
MVTSTVKKLALGVAAFLPLVSPAAAKAPAASNKVSIAPAPALGSLDVTAVTLSDLLRLYFGQLDKRPYAVCSEAVGDMRRVTVRADGPLTYPALKAVLKMHGYSMRESGGMIVVCDAESLSAKASIEPYGPPSHAEVPVYADNADAHSAPVRMAAASDGSPLRPASDVRPDGAPTPPAPEQPAATTTVIKTYKPLYRTVGSLMPALSKTGEGTFLNLSSAGGGQPGQIMAQSTFATSAATAGYSQSTDDVLVWRGTNKQWGRICDLLQAIDTPLPSAKVDIWAISVVKAQGDTDGIAFLGRIGSTNLAIGQALSNSVSVGIGAAQAVLSSVRTREDAQVIQHFSAQLIHGQQQVMRSGSSVPITGDIVDLTGGTTRQSQEYRPIGVNVTITPSIMAQSVQLGFSVEISSISSQLSTQNVNPTFNSDFVQTTLDVRPGTVSFVSALASTSGGETREKFFFVPISRTKSRRVSDVVYMIAVSAIDAGGGGADAPRAACEHGADAQTPEAAAKPEAVTKA